MNSRLQKIYKFLETANICLNNHDYDSCVSRCYYAMFHASIVALEEIGMVQAKWSHTGLINTFGKEMVKNRELFSTKISGYLKKTYDLRILGDYSIGIVDQEDANRALNMCKEFLEKLKEVFNE
ncbi:MAG: HEPN domain-containing protein [Methanosarcinales archaeon]